MNPASPTSSADSGGFSPGQKVGNGRFALIRFLGKGGMGIVWLAEDTRLGQMAALKFLPAEIRSDIDALEDMRRETVRSIKLTHSNIIRIHDLHEYAEELFIAMEFVDGATLSAIKRESSQRVMTWEQVKPLLGQLCDALDYAHSEKVIHRDLKPSNMMVDQKGRLRLADFGIAALVSDSMSRVSLQRTTSGTLVYMSPQQMNGQRPQPTDDIYALGATLYELFTSRPPFYTGEINHQVQHVSPSPIYDRLAELQIQNAIPAAVSAMVMACLAKDPAQRPQSARRVAEWIGLELGTENKSGTIGRQVSRPHLSNSSAEAREVEDPSLQTADQTGSRSKMALGFGVGIAAVTLGLALWATLGHQFPSGRTRTNEKSTAASNSMPQSVAGTTVRVSSPPGPVETKLVNRASFSEPHGFTNSLGMKFVGMPGADILMCIHETRRKDYAAYSTEVPGVNGTWKTPAMNGKLLSQEDDHPVIMVSWEDATAFCSWLSKKERRSYRLPSEHEWNLAVVVGVNDAKSISHAEVAKRLDTQMLWGSAKPEETGNYQGAEDGYAGTAPVMSFKPNHLGIYDLGGNAWEWCDGWFDAKQKHRVLRGCGYLNYGPYRKSSVREPAEPDFRTPPINDFARRVPGFRVVIAINDLSR
jgi:serine/threonine protein kinase